MSKKYNKYKIDDNVLDFFVVEEGNGGYKYLYYITNDGSLYVINADGLEDSIKPRKININNVISVIEVTDGYNDGGGEREALFVDIEGNIIKNN